MRQSVKHQPFESIYREKFAVVEERKGNTRLYPHTEQLPVLSRAINLEFYGALPDRIARTDHRGDPYRKLLLLNAARLFCMLSEMAREDGLILTPYLTRDKVAKIAIVQHITTVEPRGNLHTFRLFTGEEFVPDIHLCGKRVVFTTHVLERFNSRAPDPLGDAVGSMLEGMFGKPPLQLQDVPLPRKLLREGGVRL